MENLNLKKRTISYTISKSSAKQAAPTPTYSRVCVTFTGPNDKHKMTGKSTIPSAPHKYRNEWLHSLLTYLSKKTNAR